MTKVRIHESGTGKQVGWVEVDPKKVEEALNEFDNPTSQEVRNAKEQWIRHRGAGIAIYRESNGKYYPHKIIMRIATWDEVDELVERQAEKLKAKIKSGIKKCRGGYTVENAEQASNELGYKTPDVSKSQKEDCWRKDFKLSRLG